MNYDQVNKAHLKEGFALTYRQSDDQFLKARQAEPIGTIKQMGGREVIKTANGWRAHTKGSAAKTKDHLEKNPSANHKDEHLQKFSKETPEAELKRVIKESTDPRLREHANKELSRRKEEESGKKKEDWPKGTMKFTDNKTKKESYHVPMGDKHPKHGQKYQSHDSTGKKQGASSYIVDNVKEHGKWEPVTKEESKDAHEKRGFDEKKGDEDVTGKGEKISEEDLDLKTKDYLTEKFHSLRRLEVNIQSMQKNGYNGFKVEEWKKKAWKKAFNEKQVIEDSIEKSIYQHTKVKSILKSIGIDAQTSSSTAIRGFRNYSSGFEFPNHNLSTVDLRVNDEKFNKAISLLKEAGLVKSINGKSITLTPNNKIKEHWTGLKTKQQELENKLKD